MIKRKPTMRYPLNLERAYANNIGKYINEMDEVVDDILNKEISPSISENEIRVDGDFIEDFSLKNVQRSLSKISLLFRGIFPNRLAKKEAEKIVRSVANQNKTAMNQQLRVRGMSLLKSESWLPQFIQTKVAENVSYIQDIPEAYYKSIEQSVLRTVSNGASLDQLAEDIQKASDKAHGKAMFIARDQVGSMLGQMNAERQQRAGFRAFRWSDSGDNRVRPSHAERNGKVYYYGDNPLLPGEEYGCRCIAEPLDDDELAELVENEQNLGLTNNEEAALNRYISSDAYKLNYSLRNEEELTEDMVNMRDDLDSALEKLPTYEGMVRRSYSFYDAEQEIEFSKQFPIGHVHQFDEYLSTTKSVYDMKDSVRFVIINTRSGKDLKTYNDAEKEVLFERGSKFVVLDRRIIGGKLVITLEEYHE